MKKEVVESKISVEAIHAMDVRKIMAIAFAEMGAQMSASGYVAVISDCGNCVSVAQGVLGFQSLGERYDVYKGDVDIEVLEGVVPFLKRFSGTSMGTTQRGDFIIDNEWNHLDAGLGNHFFVRSRLLDEFLKRLGERHICEAGIDVMTDMLSNDVEMHEETRKGR